MIPYLEHPIIEIGGYPLQAFRVLALTAIVVEYTIVVRRAPRHGFSSDQASSLIAWATVFGLVSAHVFDVLAYYPERLREDPLELFRIWGSLSSWGGMLGGLGGLAFVAWRRGLGTMGVLRFLDLAIYALPFTLAVGRFGCGLQHDHLGIPSTHFLAVAFPDGPRFDLGMLEFFYLVPVAGVFFVLGRKPRPLGFFSGLYFALYSPVRFVLDTLRAEDARYFGWTPAQYLCVLMTIAGIALVVWSMRRARGPVGA
ncbi:MAG: prolipoprotein diacylglyceryl transferase family protein [Myxococcota bacterium]